MPTRSIRTLSTSDSATTSRGLSRMRAVTIATATVLSFTLAFSMSDVSSLRLNFTGSLPRGVYRISPGPPSRDALVIACLSPPVARFARRRGYIWRGDCPGGAAPVGKIVTGVPGDTIVTSEAGLFVNGHPIRNTRVMTSDSKGRPLPHVPYRLYVVPSGQLWLTSSYNAHSYDSRYFGPVSASAVRGRIASLLTFGAGPRGLSGSWARLPDP